MKSLTGFSVFSFESLGRVDPKQWFEIDRYSTGIMNSGQNIIVVSVDDISLLWMPIGFDLIYFVLFYLLIIITSQVNITASD